MVTVGTIDRSNVLRIERPGIGWIPLRKAPFHFQAVYSRLRHFSRPPHPCLLSLELIDAIVKQMITDPSIIKCEVDREEYGTGFVLYYEGCGPDPHDDESVSRTIEHNFVEPFALPEQWRRDQAQLAVQITSVWNLMEFRLRRALKAGYCRLLARCGAAYAPVFSELPPEIFESYRIIDWRNGVAESTITAGDRIYEIHVEAISSPPRGAVSSGLNDLSQIVADYPNSTDPLLDAVAEIEREGAAVSDLLEGHGKRVLKAARHFFYNPADEPIGDIISQDVKERLTLVLKSSFDARTIKTALKLARDLRTLNPESKVLAAHGFNNL